MNISIKDALDVILSKRNSDGSKTPVLNSDYCNTGSFEISSDVVKSKAKNVDMISFNVGRSGTISLEFEIYELKFLSILLGAVESSDTLQIARKEVLTVATDEVTLTDAPVADSVAVFKVKADLRSHDGEELVPDSVTGSVVNLVTEALTEGDKVVVYYLFDQATTDMMKITSVDFPDAYELTGWFTVRSIMGVDEEKYLIFHNIRPQGSVSFSFDSASVATLSASFDITADENNDMVTIADKA